MQVIDNQIFTAVKTGDERAYEQLFRAFYPRLCAFAATFVSDRDEAEEIVQTMFVKIWEQRETLDITTSVQAYLFRAVRNASFNHLKKMQRQDAYKAQNLEHIDQNPSVQPDHATHADLTERIERAISELPEQCRLIFKMSRFEELKYREIADALGISPKTVENQMGKALKVLRLKMVDYLTVALLFFLT